MEKEKECERHGKVEFVRRTVRGKWGMMRKRITKRKNR